MQLYYTSQRIRSASIVTIFTILFLLLLFFFTNIPKAQAQTGTVSGTITDEGTGSPIADVLVSLEFDGSGIGSCTDVNGDYTITDVPFDQPFRVAAGGQYGCSGSINYVREYHDGTYDWNAATIFTLSSGNTTETDVDIALTEGAFISGTVTDGLDPIEDMSVSADFMGYGFGDCTNSSGDYVLGPVPLNTGFIVHAGGGFNFCGGPTNYAIEWYNEQSNFQTADPLTLDTIGATTPDIDFTLDLGGSISGTVIDNNTSLPVEGVGVDIEQGGFGVCTDANGDYTISGLSVGQSYNVRAGGQNFCGDPDPYITEYYDNVLSAEEATPIALSEGTPDVTGIDFSLAEGGSISGTVTDAGTGQPIANMAVGFGYDNVPTGNGTCTDANGDYLITGLLLDETFRINAGGDFNWCGGSETYVREFYDSTYNYEAAVQLSATEGMPDLTGIDFVLDQGAFISGTVTEQDGGMPIENAAVDAIFEDFGIGACTDINGDYIIGPLPLNTSFTVGSGGAYENFCDGPTIYAAEWYDNQPAPELADAITLTTVGTTTPDIDFTLSIGGTISGTVYETDGMTPISGMRVGIEGYDFGFWVEVCTDIDGDFTATGLPLDANYRLRSGGENYCGNPTPYQEEFYAETPYWDQATAVPVTTGSPDVAGIDFTLAIGGVVNGNVVDGSNQPIANLAVFLDAPGFGFGTCTDQNGDYSLVGAPLDVEFLVRAGGPFNFCENGPFNYGTQYYDGVTDPALATGITLTEMSPQQDGIDFSLVALENLPVRIYPENAVELNSGNWLAVNWAQFEFVPMDGVEWYAVWVGTDDYTYEALYEWYPATDAIGQPWGQTGICDYEQGPSGVCTVPQDVWLPNGDYLLWTSYWGPDLTDNNAYWNMSSFSVGFGVPGDFNLLDPANGSTVASGPEELVWERDVEALWYRLWVGPDDYSDQLFFDWIDATVYCDTGYCNLDVSDITFADDTYEVWVEVWGPGGYVTWLQVNSGVPSTFTVDSSASVPMEQPIPRPAR